MLSITRALVPITVLALLGTAPALAADSSDTSVSEDTPAFTTTGSAVAASQYRWRGLARSDNQPVVQAAITVTHKSGFYLAGWGSSAQSGPAIDIGGTELDLYGGYTRELGLSGLNVDAGVYYYFFPGFAADNYAEGYASLTKSLGPAAVKLGVNYAPVQHHLSALAVPHHSNTYVFGEASSAIPGTPVSVHLHAGHTGGALDYVKAYTDYAAGVSYTWKKLTFDVSGVGTTLTHGDAAAAVGRTGDSLFTYSNAAQTWRAAKPVGVFSLLANF